MAVSYTHLDVYKRQGLPHAVRHAVPGLVRRTILIHLDPCLIAHLGGRRTLVHLHLGYILL